MANFNDVFGFEPFGRINSAEEKIVRLTVGSLTWEARDRSLDVREIEKRIQDTTDVEELRVLRTKLIDAINKSDAATAKVAEAKKLAEAFGIKF